jgi:glycosyltransferase involved in cell wall biosynthesis
MENKISVIIIFFNTEKYIAEAIESVISQSYDNWELILVDDGSSDNSTRIALDYAKKYPAKIYYFEHENHANRGMSASRNLGIKKSNGEYIAFLDSDDIWLPHTLKDQIEIFKSIPEVNVVYGRFENWFESDVGKDSYKLPLHQPMDHPFVKPGNIINSPQLLNLYLEGNNYILPGICSMMIKKSTIVKIGGFVESFRGMFEDHVMKSKIFLQENAYFIDSVLSKYRRHSESESIKVKISQQKPLLKLLFLLWLELYISQTMFRDTELWRNLQNNIDITKEKLIKKEEEKSIKIEKLNSRINELEK